MPFCWAPNCAPNPGKHSNFHQTWGKIKTMTMTKISSQKWSWSSENVILRRRELLVCCFEFSGFRALWNLQQRPHKDYIPEKSLVFWAQRCFLRLLLPAPFPCKALGATFSARNKAAQLAGTGLSRNRDDKGAGSKRALCNLIFPARLQVQ